MPIDRPVLHLFLHIFMRFVLWPAVWRERRALADLPPHRRRDLGLSEADVLRECGRPFWRVGAARAAFAASLARPVDTTLRPAPYRCAPGWRDDGLDPSRAGDYRPAGDAPAGVAKAAFPGAVDAPSPELNR